MITLHPLPELTKRGRLNRTHVRNLKATCKKGQASARTRDADECCECARQPGAESC